MQEGETRFMGKLHVEDRVAVPPDTASKLAQGLFEAAGAGPDVAAEVAGHLIEADQCGVESHGFVRTIQYMREMLDGTVIPTARPIVNRLSDTVLMINAQGGIGIPAMRRTHELAVEQAQQTGLAAVGLLGAGHTGRLGAFGDIAANRHCLSITLGGGNRKTWRMVAPYGGREAMLPTNPFCIAMPGGDLGPVIIDIATSQAAGGWIYAPRAAGVSLPEGLILDRHGAPSCDPQDYFDGGAILPKGGPLGYGMALIAELIGEAMLGPVEKGEINWLVLAVDCRSFNQAYAMQRVAEEILSEIRASAPQREAEPVQIPGERERALHAASQGQPLMVPRKIWETIMTLAQDHGVEVPDL